MQILLRQRQARRHLQILCSLVVAFFSCAFIVGTVVKMHLVMALLARRFEEDLSNANGHRRHDRRLHHRLAVL